MTKEHEATTAHLFAEEIRSGFSGSIWKHYKTGRLYLVLDVVVDESDLVIMVVYRDLEMGRTWCRPHVEWQGIVTDPLTSKPVYRYSRCEGRLGL